MRISLTIKLFVAFLLVAGACLIPIHFLMQRWQREFFKVAEMNLNHRAERIVTSLASIPRERYAIEIRRLSETAGARITIFSIDRQLLEDSSQASYVDTQSESEELLDAFRRPNDYGHALRSISESDTYLYVTRLFVGPAHQVGLVRLAELFPTSLLRQFELGERIVAGVAASIILVILLLFVVLTIRPLQRLKQNIDFLTEGEYSRTLIVSGQDEIGDLGRALLKLHTHLRKEALETSVSDASCAELIRILPIPLSILRSDFGLKHINSAFREAASIDAATEHARFHSLRLTPEFVMACEQAQATLEPQQALIRLPWLHRKLALQICPLPIDRGQVEWALLIPDFLILVPVHLKEASAILKQSHSVLERIVQGDPSDYSAHPEILIAGYVELRILSAVIDIMQAEERPTTIFPIKMSLLLPFVIAELKPILDEAQISLEWSNSTTAEFVEISDSMKRVEYVILAALIRVISEIRSQRGSKPEKRILSLSIEVTDTSVICSLSGNYRPIFCADLDRLLAPLGGAMGPIHEEFMDSTSSLHQTLSAASTSESGALWIRLRRA